MCIGGEPTHAVRKLPGRRRVPHPRALGRHAELVEADAEMLGVAHAALATLAAATRLRPGRRAVRRGRPRVVELELVEPYLYLEMAPEAAERLAGVLVRRVAERGMTRQVGDRPSTGTARGLRRPVRTTGAAVPFGRCPAVRSAPARAARPAAQGRGRRRRAGRDHRAAARRRRAPAGRRSSPTAWSSSAPARWPGGALTPAGATPRARLVGRRGRRAPGARRCRSRRVRAVPRAQRRGARRVQPWQVRERRRARRCSTTTATPPTTPRSWPTWPACSGGPTPCRRPGRRARPLPHLRPAPAPCGGAGSRPATATGSPSRRCPATTRSGSSCTKTC